ncbi:MAG: murein transglycosylase domain-containing protein [Campylobacterota bacterium]|nr:murein transglycosylase domain-containing protein [Campylobacterota bacterium]
MKNFIISLVILIAIFDSTLLAQDNDMLQDISNLRAKYQGIIDDNRKFYKNTIEENRKFYTGLISKQWGKNNVKFSDKKSFTQYSKDLKQRETIDYKKGRVTLEILSDKRPTLKEFDKKYKKLSKQTISQNTKNDPLFKNSKIDKTNNQQLNKKIIKQKKFNNQDIKTKYVDNKTIYYIDVPLVSGYIKKLANHYMKDIKYYSKLYDIKPSYILAIIQTESSFNPNAVSYVPAFGLMQIVPNTAGKDVNRYLTGKKSKPTQNYLENPSNNIKMGTTYIKIIQSRYLKGVKNKENLYLCTSTAYNAGIGNLYKSFTGSKAKKTQTIRKINNSNADDIYNHLYNSTRLTDEANQYVRKVRDFGMRWERSLKNGEI